VRVLHWYSNFLHGGGVANTVLGLALAQARAGAEVRIAAAEKDGETLYGSLSEADELLVTWKPTWQRQLGSMVWRGLPRSLRDEIAAFRPEVVHAHAGYNPDNLWAVRVAAPEAAVMSLQGAFEPGVFEKSKGRSKRVYIRLERRFLYSRLDALHALSPREAELARSSAPAVRTYVLPQGGGPAVVAPPTPRKADGTTLEIVYVGRLDVFTKGLDLLLRALAEVIPEDPDIRVTLVGPDWLGGRPRLEQLAEELGIRHAVTLTGSVTGEEVARRVDAADAVALPSRHEGFSLSATEALVRGKPLVLSRETGHASYPEIAGAAHVLVVAPEVGEIAGALRALRERRDELRAAAEAQQRDLAEFLSWDRVAREHLAAYCELAGRARGGSPG
jgi:glycosyltransferase involved in cell wall biosynthesis